MEKEERAEGDEWRMKRMNKKIMDETVGSKSMRVISRTGREIKER